MKKLWDIPSIEELNVKATAYGGQTEDVDGVVYCSMSPPIGDGECTCEDCS